VALPATNPPALMSGGTPPAAAAAPPAPAGLPTSPVGAAQPVLAVPAPVAVSPAARAVAPRARRAVFVTAGGFPIFRFYVMLVAAALAALGLELVFGRMGVRLRWTS
jgi:hypothetical protein